MESFTLGRLAHAIGAAQPRNHAVVATGVSTDTRALGAGEVFFAVSGENFNGALFLAEAFRRGAAAAVVEAGAPAPAGLGPILWVPSVRQALLDFARSYREELGFTVVAITGSAGKTTTKDMIFHLVSGRRRAIKAAKSFNNEVGVPLTIFQADAETEVAVLELGTNAPGEIAALAAVAQPDVAVITCIGRSHLERLGGVDGVAREKLSLLEHLRPGGAVVFNGDDPRLAAAGRAFAAAQGPERLSLCGAIPPEGLDWEGEVVSKGRGWRVETRRAAGRGPTFTLPLPGQHLVTDALLALAVCERIGLDPVRCAADLASFSGSPGRFTIREAGGVTLVDDTYNANPTSVNASLEGFQSLAPAAQRVVVLGAMGELGPESERYHREIGQAVARLGVARLVTVGTQAGAIASGARAAGLLAVVEVGDAEEAAARLGTLAPGAAVLFKASRAERLERAVAATEARLSASVSASRSRAA